MNWVAEILAKNLLNSEIIDKSEYCAYKYGITIFLEKVIYYLICFIIILILKAPLEGFFFIIIFTPLRIYAGGLHLEHFSSCLILSSLIFFATILLAKTIKVPMIVSIFLLSFSLALIHLLYPVENENREVDDEENKLFERKLFFSVILVIMLAVVLFLIGCKKLLFVISMTSLVTVITMACGKIKANLISK